MPTRILREGILRSKIVNRLDWGAEIFYRRLMSIVDDYGLFESDPDLLRAYLYPLKLDRVSTADIVKWMRCVAEAGLVSEYEAQGKDYGAIERFDQRTDTAPKCPLPPWMKLQIGGEKRKTYRAIDARIMRNPGDPSGTPGNSGELRGNPAVGGDEGGDEGVVGDEGGGDPAHGADAHTPPKNNYPQSVDDVIVIASDPRCGMKITRDQAEAYFLARDTSDWYDMARRKIPVGKVYGDLKRWLMRDKEQEQRDKSNGSRKNFDF